MIFRPRFFALVVVLLALSSLRAQYGLSLTNLEFSGTNGRVFKPALVPELSYRISEIDDNFQVGASIGFSILATRQDTFFNYGLRFFNGTTALPAFEIYEQVKYIPISFFYTYMPLDSPLRPIVGLAVNADILIYNYESLTETVISSKEQNKEYAMLGLMPYLGGSYQINEQLRGQLRIGRQFAIDTNRSWQRLWRSTLSVIYYFY